MYFSAGVDCRDLEHLALHVSWGFLREGAVPYPPVLGAHDEQRALREGAEGDALAVLAVDGLGLLLKHGGGVLGQTQQPSATSSLLPAPCQALLQVPQG